VKTITTRFLRVVALLLDGPAVAVVLGAVLLSSVLVCSVLVCAVVVCSAPFAAAADSRPRVLFSYTDPRITESSGLAHSLLHDGIVYTHNDTEQGARIFAVGTDGKTKAVYTLRDVEPRDWEGIAVGKTPGGTPAIFVGDIGDNFGGVWPEVWVYRFSEPKTVTDQAVTPTRFRFQYEDGPRDAEALLVDPRENRIYIVSKEVRDAGVYLAPPQDELSTTKVNVLRRIATAPPAITDGAFSPDGKRLVLRDYVFAHVYAQPDGDPIARITLPLQRQGESVTFTTNGKSLLAGTEGAKSQVWQVPVPASALPQPSPTGNPTSSNGTATEAAGNAETSAASSEQSGWEFGGNLLALIFSGVAFFGLFRVIAARRGKLKKG
jgi:hypothetical protein